MKVKIIKFTPEPEKTIVFAAKTCYTNLELDELQSKIEDSQIKPFLKDVILSGHHSVLEHASFTFAIEGVSRSLLAQLTRHRIASYSVQSQRYVKFKELNYVVPPSIEEKPHLKWIFSHLVDSAKECYDKLINEGIPPEDARYILPQCTSTKIILTMNARELLHFFKLRLCNRAQWEIRNLAQEMLNQLMEVAPNIFYFAGPNCKIDTCKETKPCGKPYHKLKL